MTAGYGQRQCVEGAKLPWVESPMMGVTRKRLWHVGAAESGIVTSLVRYQPGSRFASHAHPQGEEILVLDGVFSDEHGHYPAGTHLLNPDGSSHAPYSDSGCLLLVKLRQYDGQGRRQQCVDSGELPWESTATPGLLRKPLYHQPGFSQRIELLQLRPGTQLTDWHHPNGAEIFLLEGEVQEGVLRHGDGQANLEEESTRSGSERLKTYGPETWWRLPAGYRHDFSSASGCVLYLCRG
ncbi:cupin domain-containing protein [Ferrimonas gelatinilytica]|uniref:ChrR-like cupin domain-containing protein n=1 Tax=Ferrimonas gelatinilytica TaxID=1255257 RepID=A0ABP9RZM8_9GAMM